jgi:hypothetical protein
MLFSFAPDKYGISGPKGLEHSNSCTGDKSPAYPEGEFFRSLQKWINLLGLRTG